MYRREAFGDGFEQLWPDKGGSGSLIGNACPLFSAPGRGSKLAIVAVLRRTRQRRGLEAAPELFCCDRLGQRHRDETDVALGILDQQQDGSCGRLSSPFRCLFDILSSVAEPAPAAASDDDVAGLDALRRRRACPDRPRATMSPFTWRRYLNLAAQLVGERQPASSRNDRRLSGGGLGLVLSRARRRPSPPLRPQRCARP